MRNFYTSKKWRNVRIRALKRDKYLCQECKKYFKNTEATVVHHIVEVSEDITKAYCLSNLESLCNSCHNKRHPNKASCLKYKNRRRY